MEIVDPRREKLNAWRKATGRTPMKRPSLVQECYKTVSTNPTHPPTYIRTPAQLNSTARRKTLSTHSTKKIAQKVSSENSKTVGQTSEQKMTETSSRKLTRREMLEQWLTIHGSTVKRPRSVLQPLNYTRAQTDVKKRRLSSAREFPPSPGTLRKQLQREIDEDCQEAVLDDSETGKVARELDYGDELDHTDCSQDLPFLKHKLPDDLRGRLGAECKIPLIVYDGHQVHSRRSLVTDPTVMFPSSAIRYSLISSTEPSQRHKRRHTMSLCGREREGVVFLTPVRRSTRQNRRSYVYEKDCIDSPSQLTSKDDITVEIIPNKALQFIMD